MSAVEDIRHVPQDFLAAELRDIRQLMGFGIRLETMEKRLDAMDKRLETMEVMNGVRFQAIVQRLEQVQQSFAFDERISNLEAEKTRSA